jgi:acyl-CoA thioesterase FadM
LFDLFLPIEKMLEENIYLAVISSEMKYKKQSTLGDKPVGKIKLIDCCRGIFSL